MGKTIYATKVWRGEYPEALVRHKKADLVIGNNLDVRFINLGEIDDYYLAPEKKAIYEAKKMGAEYILWYASDVIPPEKDWTVEAKEYLKKYPIVSPNPYGANVRKRKDEYVEYYDWGWAATYFTDQAYMAKVDTMLEIDYELEHPIRNKYPAHGKNSFERRVAQWLAVNNKKVAFLEAYRYHHIDRKDK